MCGINGFNFVSKEKIESMNKITSHRGPNQSQIWIGKKVSFGHNRLSIIDLSKTGNQPMHSKDGNLVIIYNGELYNFQDLKKELPDYNFIGSSDTEVILAAFQKWGHDCIKKFNGMFAFAIWDKKNQELFLARDQIGIKPLYYFWDNKQLIFSSEIKAILTHDIPRHLDTDALNHYLRLLFVPEPRTMFADIKKLPPRSYATLKKGKFEIKKYWEPSRGEYTKKSKAELVKETKEQVENAVERQLVSDKPLGVYLSGGIDSSVVLHSMAKKHSKIDTFSVGFELSDGEEQKKFNADFHLAKKTSEFYKANHHEVLVSEKDVAELLEKAIWHMDEPVSKPTAIAMMKIAQFAKKNVDVVLGGDGGDEIFGGYERYRLSLLSSYYQKIPSPIRSIASLNSKLKKLNTPPGIHRYSLFMFQKDKLLERVLSKDFFNQSTYQFFDQQFFQKNPYKTFEEQMMDTDRQSWLVDDSLILTDKMAMSAGLEGRVPLLDKELVEFAAKIPLKYKVTGRGTKVILKEAFRGHIPELLYNQPKRGWYAPGSKWLRLGPIYNLAEEALTKEYNPNTAHLFNWDYLQKLLVEHKEKKGYHVTILWAVLTFQIWAKLYKITNNK